MLEAATSDMTTYYFNLVGSLVVSLYNIGVNPLNGNSFAESPKIIGFLDLFLINWKIIL